LTRPGIVGGSCAAESNFKRKPALEHDMASEAEQDARKQALKHQQLTAPLNRRPGRGSPQTIFEGLLEVSR
jgi:hypothetical protein